MGILRNSPKASPRKKSTSLQLLFDWEPNNSNGTKIFSPKSGKQSAFESEYGEILSIISHCRSIFTFTDRLESPSERDLKRSKLFQLLSFASPSICQTNLVSTLSPAWPHLQAAYDILLRLVLNIDPKILRCYVDEPFLVNLLSLFQSENPREREKKHSGTGELLEIWGSIINGFAVPLKEEHKLFLMRVLMPLHKGKGMQKEVLLIGELEELVENIDPGHYRKLALPICAQISRCKNSLSSQVAERALYVWNNEQFVKMASSMMEEDRMLCLDVALI
ncbi:hypothetical protein POTOM_016080 [Populus tomentosa]|uniref:Uncharacterized protein n=1 Tax=Populus tomentosa TaxID=118781 RepID=A0A8X8A119_POPTO|nr:hypothetical protein POTOM_016080 [Populus tomentosa]